MPATRASRKRVRPTGVGRGIRVWLFRILLLFVLASLSLVLALRWLDPPLSSFMLQHLVSQGVDGRGRMQLYYRWVPLHAISPPMALAVVAAEDQRFPLHHGFDWQAIGQAVRDFRQGGRLRGASTLSQQLAKNLFLWSGRDPLRKLLEVWFTALLELLLPKERILELYLNVAQFGTNTFGVGMASERYFQRSAVALGASEASLLAAVLPNPRRYRLRAPSPKLRQRAAWIRGQMKNLGSGYLDGLSRTM